MDIAALAKQESAATQAQSRIAENFDTFLQLLTTQLQYQDPLEPMDSNEFTAQLVQFADVEQSIAANKNLEKLVNFALANATSSAAGFLGREVTAGGESAELVNGSARWNYTIGAGATQAAINITDAAGNVVYQTTGQIAEGNHVFDWDGRNMEGGIAPDGTYLISVAAVNGSGAPVPTSTNVTGIVSSVEIAGIEPLLTVGGVKLRPADIISIAEPTAPDATEPTETTEE